MYPHYTEIILYALIGLPHTLYRPYVKYTNMYLINYLDGTEPLN